MIPLSMLFAVTGMVAGRISANLLSLGAIDFGIIVDGAVVMVENIAAALRAAAARAGPAARRSRAPPRDASRAANEVARPTLFGVGDHHDRLPADPDADRHRGEDVPPDGAGRAARARRVRWSSLSPSFPRSSRCSCAAGSRRVESPVIRAGASGSIGLSLALGPAQDECPWSWRALMLFVGCGVLATRLGSEFVPTLDERDIAIHALRIPGTSLEQAVAMQGGVESALRAFPEVERVFSKIGTAEIATDPMPPSVSDVFVISSRAGQWPEPAASQGRAHRGPWRRALEPPAGQRLRVHAADPDALQRTDRRRARDVAVKVFGDDLDALLRDRGARSRACFARCPARRT